MRKRFALRLAGLALLPSLGGCVAVAAIPVLAAGGMIVRNQVHIRAATPNAEAPRSAALAPSERLTSTAESITPMRLTALTELPPPSGADPIAELPPSDKWEKFVSYALGKSGEVSRTGGQSALLDQGTSLGVPRRRNCRSKYPAVLIDLDQATVPFAPENGTKAVSGLAAGLERLRQAGVVVAWISKTPAAQVSLVGRALQESGLDPSGRDPLLLVRNSEDRKQTLREEANEDVCIIAIAGDQRSDFDELFDYLRDPKAADGFDMLLGSGWFLVPLPLG